MAEVPALRLKIIDVVKIPSAEEDRIGKYDTVVTYQDANGRTRVVTIPWKFLEGKTEDEQFAIITEYIRKEEGFRKAMIGREITI